KLQQTLVMLVKQSDPPAGWDPAAHAWMRRLAGKTLGALGNPDPTVVDAIAAVVRDPKARPLVRRDRVQCLGQLKYPAGRKTNVKELANAVGHQTLDLGKGEVETAESAKREPSRQLLRYVVASCMLALEGRDGRGGLLAGASGDDQKFIDNLRAQVK